MMIHRALQICSMMFIMMLMTFSGCLFVWEEEEFYPPMALSGKPEVSMSRITVESKDGDMIAFLPEGWHLLGKEHFPSNDVFALAIDSSMTLSAVFSSLPLKAKDSSTIVDVNEMMRFAMNRHSQKSGGAIQQIGKGRALTIGRRTFGYITFAQSNDLIAKALVWRSNSGNHYECAIVPLDITSSRIPSDSVQSAIIRSMATTILF